MWPSDETTPKTGINVRSCRYPDIVMSRMAYVVKQATFGVTVPLPNNSGWNDIIVDNTTGIENPQIVTFRPVKSDPIKIVKGKIRIDKDKMEDGVPYAFQYQDKYYMLARIDGNLTLYGMR